MNDTRVALVTGASARIGLAIATRLAGVGYAVALHASPRSRHLAERQAQILTARGVRCCVLDADLADPAACRDLIDAATCQIGPLTLLVNNAAVFEPDAAASVDPVLWDQHFAVNLRAPVILSSAFAGQAQADVDASVVNLIDQRVLRPTPDYFSYTLAKSALWTATQTMARAFATQGVRVNAIGPGPVLPNAHDGQAGFTREVAALPLHRRVNPDDVAAGVLYLAEARAVTGQMIMIDAGQHLA